MRHDEILVTSTPRGVVQLLEDEDALSVAADPEKVVRLSFIAN